MKLRSLIFAAFLTLPFASSFAQVGISVNFAPPVLPVYEQPPCPVAGYIWTPGYWAWATGGYYWVPGVWVAPPAVGLLWTPAWWGWNNGVYAFHEGYWGPTVGFYGGINYGHGYWGDGYWGGHWEGNAFRYNTAVTRVNSNIVHNTYIDRTVVNKQVNTSRAAFNGPNGVKAEPTAEQKGAAENARKMGPTSQQLARQEAASKDRNLQASVNKGHPNPDAIRSFNKNPRQGKGGTQGPTSPAGAAKAGNVAEHGPELQGGLKEMPRGPGPGVMPQKSRHPQMGPRNAQTATQHHPQMGGKHPQMGGKHPQTGGGNRPAPKGQPQGKKKPGKP